MSLDYDIKFEKISGVFLGREESTAMKSYNQTFTGTTSSGQSVTVHGPAQTYAVTDGDLLHVRLDERAPSRSIGHKTDIRNDPDNGVSLLDVLVPHTFYGDDLRKRDAVDVWLMQRESVGRSMFMFLVNKSQRYARLTTEQGVRRVSEHVARGAAGWSFTKAALLRYLALVVLWVILSAGPDDSALWNTVVLLAKPAIMFVLAIALALRLLGKNGIFARIQRYTRVSDAGGNAIAKLFLISTIFGYIFLFMFGWSPLVKTPHVYAPSVFLLAVPLTLGAYLSKWERAAADLAQQLSRKMLALIQESYADDADLRVIQMEAAT